MSGLPSTRYLTLKTILSKFAQQFFDTFDFSSIDLCVHPSEEEIQVCEIVPVLKSLENEQTLQEVKEQSFQFFTHFYKYSCSDSSLRDLVMCVFEDKAGREEEIVELFSDLHLHLNLVK